MNTAARSSKRRMRTRRIWLRVESGSFKAFPMRSVRGRLLFSIFGSFLSSRRGADSGHGHTNCYYPQAADEHDISTYLRQSTFWPPGQPWGAAASERDCVECSDAVVVVVVSMLQGCRASRVSVHATSMKVHDVRCGAESGNSVHTRQISTRSCSPPSTMSFVAARGVAASRLLAARRPQVLPLLTRRSAESRRNLLNFLRRKPKNTPSEPEPILSQDDLFHPFSQSPFPAISARGEAIQKLAPCPTCLSEHTGTHAHVKAQPKNVKFECPDCGWPTHCSEEHWKADENHAKYCSRLREVNEDDHDLRSGRRIQEFELPGAPHLRCFCVLLCLIPSAGPQDTEAAISFANWDVFWYTRNFPSMDTERSRRHSSKLLTYPLTVGSVLHQWSPLMLSNQRLTPEGSRSLAG